jgi:hypothetical protein
MTYRGVVRNGVVVLEGEKLVDGTIVDVTPLDQERASGTAPADHPAIGIWKDRKDLPADAVDASNVLRQKLMHRSDE